MSGETGPVRASTPTVARGVAVERRQPADLAEILERVLNTGIVIAGEIRIDLLDIELLTIKLRLVITSLDRAEEVGLDWWRNDPWYSSGAHQSGRRSMSGGSPGGAIDLGDVSPVLAGRATDEDHTAKKSVAKKSAATKSSTKKSGTKKSAAKKSAANKSAIRRSAAKKRAAKKRSGDD